MKGYTMERSIPAPPSAVFAVLADLDQAREWMPKIRAIEKLGDAWPMQKGSKWIETRDTPRGPFVSTIEVTEFEEGRVFAIRAENSKAELTFRFDLSGADGGTKVVAQSAGRLKGLMALFSGKLVAQMKAEDADILERLEAQVAKSAGGSRPKAAKKAAAKAPAAKGKKAAKTAK